MNAWKYTPAATLEFRHRDTSSAIRAGTGTAGTCHAQVGIVPTEQIGRWGGVHWPEPRRDEGGKDRQV